jgi:TolB-like protein
MRRFLAELRRRRVFHTAFWYIGSSVAVVEAANIFLPSFGAPAGAVRPLAIAAAFGLPVALTLSWFFDVATEATPRARGWQHAVVVVAVSAVSLLGAWAVWRRADVPAATPGTASASSAVEPSHIAVLGFDAIGNNPELATFATNLHARLIDGLSRASSARAGAKRMRVISRASILPYAKGDVPLDSLRRMFRVGTVLQGTVEDVGNTVRVHVRLIDTESGDQLATRVAQESSDNPVTLLDAVSDSVVHLIREALGPIVRERMQLLETRNPQAFERFAQATQLLDEFQAVFNRRDVDGALAILGDADSLFAEAEGLDRRWIEPIVQRGRLAFRHDRIHLVKPEHDLRRILNIALQHADRALKLKPNDYRALQLRGELRNLELTVVDQRDSAQISRVTNAAERDLRAALAGNPTPGRALNTLSEVAARNSRFEDALRYGTRAYEEDPYLEQTYMTVFRLFEYSFALGKDADAAKWCREGKQRFAMHMFDDCRLSLGAWSDAYPLTPDSAWTLVKAELAAYPPPLRPVLEPRLHVMVAAVLVRSQMRDSAIALLRSSRAHDNTLGVLRAAAGVHSLLGQPDSALAAVRAILAKSSTERAGLMSLPELRRVRGDARFQQIVAN